MDVKLNDIFAKQNAAAKKRHASPADQLPAPRIVAPEIDDTLPPGLRVGLNTAAPGAFTDLPRGRDSATLVLGALATRRQRSPSPLSSERRDVGHVRPQAYRGNAEGKRPDWTGGLPGAGVSGDGNAPPRYEPASFDYVAPYEPSAHHYVSTQLHEAAVTTPTSPEMHVILSQVLSPVEMDKWRRFNEEKTRMVREWRELYMQERRRAEVRSGPEQPVVGPADRTGHGPGGRDEGFVDCWGDVLGARGEASSGTQKGSHGTGGAQRIGERSSTGQTTRPPLSLNDALARQISGGSNDAGIARGVQSLLSRRPELTSIIQPVRHNVTGLLQPSDPRDRMASRGGLNRPDAQAHHAPGSERTWVPSSPTMNGPDARPRSAANPTYRTNQTGPRDGMDPEEYWRELEATGQTIRQVRAPQGPSVPSSKSKSEQSSRHDPGPPPPSPLNPSNKGGKNTIDDMDLTMRINLLLLPARDIVGHPHEISNLARIQRVREDVREAYYLARHSPTAHTPHGRALEGKSAFYMGLARVKPGQLAEHGARWLPWFRKAALQAKGHHREAVWAEKYLEACERAPGVAPTLVYSSTTRTFTLSWPSPAPSTGPSSGRPTARPLSSALPSGKTPSSAPRSSNPPPSTSTKPSSHGKFLSPGELGLAPSPTDSEKVRYQTTKVASPVVSPTVEERPKTAESYVGVIYQAVKDFTGRRNAGFEPKPPALEALRVWKNNPDVRRFFPNAAGTVSPTHVSPRTQQPARSDTSKRKPRSSRNGKERATEQDHHGWQWSEERPFGTRIDHSATPKARTEDYNSEEDDEFSSHRPAGHPGPYIPESPPLGPDDSAELEGGTQEWPQGEVQKATPAPPKRMIWRVVNGLPTNSSSSGGSNAARPALPREESAESPLSASNQPPPPQNPPSPQTSPRKSVSWSNSHDLPYHHPQAPNAPRTSFAIPNPFASSPREEHDPEPAPKLGRTGSLMGRRLSKAVIEGSQAVMGGLAAITTARAVAPDQVAMMEEGHSPYRSTFGGEELMRRRKSEKSSAGSSARVEEDEDEWEDMV